MREKFSLRIMISVFVALALLVCALLSVSSSLEPNEPKFKEIIGVPSLTDIEIRNPEIALKYGVTGYLEITYPSDSPSLLSVDRGGEININFLLHFVSHTPEVTEAQVNIDPMHPWGPRIEQGDVIFNELVSYNLSGNISIKAGETIPVIMSIRIPGNFPSYINSIPLGGMGIRADVPVIDELGEKEVTITLKGVEMSAAGVKFYAFVVPLDYSPPQPPPGIPPPPTAPVVDSVHAEYIVDDITKKIGYSGIGYPEDDGIKLILGYEPLYLDPVPSDAEKLTLRITKIDDWEGPWEFEIPLD